MHGSAQLTLSTLLSSKIPCPGSGATHLGCSSCLTRWSPTDSLTNQPNEDNPSLRLPSQVILYHIKVTIKINHHKELQHLRRVLDRTQGLVSLAWWCVFSYPANLHSKVQFSICHMSLCSFHAQETINIDQTENVFFPLPPTLQP